MQNFKQYAQEAFKNPSFFLSEEFTPQINFDRLGRNAYAGIATLLYFWTKDIPNVPEKIVIANKTLGLGSGVLSALLDKYRRTEEKQSLQKSQLKPQLEQTIE